MKDFQQIMAANRRALKELETQELMQLIQERRWFYNRHMPDRTAMLRRGRPWCSPTRQLFQMYQQKIKNIGNIEAAIERLL